jgi:hypothetical protein
MITCSEENGLWAVDVRSISTIDCSWQTVRDGFDISRLPRRIVQRKDFDRSAVLSWRWDRDLFQGRSRNVALALHHAMKTGIELLFVDVVTVDQTLSPAKLPDKVSELAVLYKELPVIVAGDRPDVPQEEWDRTFRRPWLLYEARSYAVNSAGITYLGYRDAASSEVPQADFADEVERIRTSGFAIYVFYVLWGYVGMQNPEDLKYILRPFYSLFGYLYEQMSRNDFLFSVFMVCAINAPGQIVHSGDRQIDNGYRINFHDLRLDAITFERFSIGEHEPSRHVETKRTISLNGHPVAEWRSKMTTSYDRNWIKVLPNADDRLFDLMKVPNPVREGYKNNIHERQACLYLDLNAPKPDVRQFTAYLNSEHWMPFRKGE